MMIYEVANGQYISAAVLLAGLIVMSIIRRFVEPAVLGKSLKMHPLITLIAMAAGVYIWGAAGFLLGPVLVIIIIQVIKVFEIDKIAGKYFSGVLDRFMNKEDDKASKESLAEEEAAAEAEVTENIEDETPGPEPVKKRSKGKA